MMVRRDVKQLITVRDELYGNFTARFEGQTSSDNAHGFADGDINGGGDCLIALCTDGTMWRYNWPGDYWEVIASIPQEGAA